MKLLVSINELIKEGLLKAPILPFKNRSHSEISFLFSFADNKKFAKHAESFAIYYPEPYVLQLISKLTRLVDFSIHGDLKIEMPLDDYEKLLELKFYSRMFFVGLANLKHLEQEETSRELFSLLPEDFVQGLMKYAPYDDSDYGHFSSINCIFSEINNPESPFNKKLMELYDG